jgi:CBS domain-containing protein
MPDFNSIYIDSQIRFAIVEPPVETRSLEQPTTEETQNVLLETVDSIPVLIAGAVSDPAFRIGRLASANMKPLSVVPDSTLSEVVTLMLRHDFSQLPVMTNNRDVKGIISWESIGSRLALGKTVTVARECMKAHHEVSLNDSLFRVIAQIVEHSYVLVRGEDRTITGIVTTTDLSLQFQQLSEPFLLLSEIENHVRLLIDGRFTADELTTAKGSADPDRKIKSVADLTFGEYIRLLENPTNWTKTGLTVDRAIFVRELAQVRRIRNDVMHFDPDGITDDDHQLLLYFVQFLHKLRAISA